jgi:uncharacterized protein YgiM (DUF1202 family)
MRRFLPLVLVLAAVAPSLTAESQADPGQPAATSDDGSLKGITATVSGRANVRYGPSTHSRIACTLNPGDAVAIVGPAPVPDWYTIRFPAKGQAWVHKHNLTPVDGGKRWKVTGTGARARSDATLGADIVAELATGEIIEDRASSRGEWVAVSIPSAVAYIHKSLLNLPSATAISEQQAQASKLQQVWGDAQAAYARIWADLKDHPEHAVSVDWAPLLAQLDEVAKGHPEPAVQMNAKRLYDAISEVMKKTQSVTDASSGGAPVGGTAASPGGAAGGTVAENPPSGDGQYHKTGIDAQDPLQLPAGSTQPAPAPTDNHPAVDSTPAAPPANYVVVGFISTNVSYPNVSAKFEVMDQNSAVIAFLTEAPGRQLNLSQYDMRWVGVLGSSAPLPAGQTNLSPQPPLIEVSDVRLNPPASP